jgi:hypothetical protein
MNVFAFTTMAVLAAGSVDASVQSIDGVWRSHGWGFVYEIRGAALQVFEVTTSTCVRSFRAERSSTGSSGRDATFRAHDGNAIRIVTDGVDDRARVVHPGGLTNIFIERLTALPEVCAPPTANTPIGNFNVFARTFAENYISFDLRRINWDRVVAEQRAKISPQISPAQLFDTLAAMIQPLADIHTGIEAPKMRRAFDAPLRPGTDRAVHGNIGRFAKTGRRKLAAITNHAYLRDPVRSLCRGQWQYGSAGNGIGYLRILSFGDYSRRGGFEGNLRALNHALDKILGQATLRALVIDVRMSFGGDDQLGLAIAARLTTKEYMAYGIQARSDPREPSRYTQLQAVSVRPSTRPVFSGPVVELIGPITMSAAETFTQALMERTPRVMRIGENTQGVFCDVLGRHLPNGWSFGLRNAVYRTSEGRAFDVQGIPPDIAVPVFADDDVAARLDPGMSAAMDLLTHSSGK